MNNKQITIEQAAELVKPGSMLALGGMTLYRRPVAFVRTLIKRYQQTGEPADLTCWHSPQVMKVTCWSVQG